MAVLVDREVQKVVRSRREAGKASTVWVHRIRLPRSGWSATVEWTRQAPPADSAVRMDVAGVSLWMDERIAAYARWHSLTLAVAKTGPFRSIVLDDPLLMFHVAAWETTHPGLKAA